jgi:hypothetical protein
VKQKENGPNSKTDKVFSLGPKGNRRGRKTCNRDVLDNGRQSQKIRDPRARGSFTGMCPWAMEAAVNLGREAGESTELMCSVPLRREENVAQCQRNKC